MEIESKQVVLSPQCTVNLDHKYLMDREKVLKAITELLCFLLCSAYSRRVKDHDFTDEERLTDKGHVASWLKFDFANGTRDALLSSFHGSDANRARLCNILSQGWIEPAACAVDVGVPTWVKKTAAPDLAKYVVGAIDTFFRVETGEGYSQAAAAFLLQPRVPSEFRSIANDGDLVLLLQAFRDIYTTAYPGATAHREAFLHWLPQDVMRRVDDHDRVAAVGTKSLRAAFAAATKDADVAAHIRRIAHFILILLEERDRAKEARVAAVQFQELQLQHQKQQQQQQQPRRPQAGEPFCHKCNSGGHVKKDCPKYLCNGCQKMGPGHTWPNCPNPTVAYRPGIRR